MNWTAQWAESSTAAGDIRASLTTAFEKILDATLQQQVAADFRIVLSESRYHQLKTYYARWMWRDAYRAARVLGNRQLAFDQIGNRRRFAH